MGWSVLVSFNLLGELEKLETSKSRSWRDLCSSMRVSGPHDRCKAHSARELIVNGRSKSSPENCFCPPRPLQPLPWYCAMGQWPG